MNVKYRDIEEAYTLANAGKYEESTSVLDKTTGQFYAQSESSDVPISDEVLASEHVVPLPDKKNLGLASPLIFRFVREVFPDGYDKVSEIFTRRGAYGRYKKWLIANKLLDKWEAYSIAAEETALRKWCADNGIELAD